MIENNKNYPYHVLLKLNDNKGDSSKILALLERIVKKDSFIMKSIDKELSSLSFNDMNDFVIFINSFSALTMDCLFLNRAIIVPSLDEIFYLYLDRVKEGEIEYLYNVVNKDDYKNFYPLIAEFDDENLTTIKNYIEYNNSPSISSIASYSHKNTVAYRVNNFISSTSLDIELFYNRLFVLNLLIDYLKNIE